MYVNAVIIHQFKHLTHKAISIKFSLMKLSNSNYYKTSHKSKDFITTNVRIIQSFRLSCLLIV